MLETHQIFPNYTIDSTISKARIDDKTWAYILKAKLFLIRRCDVNRLWVLYCRGNGSRRCAPNPFRNCHDIGSLGRASTRLKMIAKIGKAGIGYASMQCSELLYKEFKPVPSR